MKSREAAGRILAWLGCLTLAQASLGVSSLPIQGVKAFAAVSGLAVATAGKSVNLYSLEDGKPLASYPVEGTVLAVAAGPEGAAWLVDGAGRRELVFRSPSGELGSFVVPASGGQRLAWVGGFAAVLGDMGGALWDPRTRRWTGPEEALPPEAARLFSSSYVQSSPNGLVSFIRPFRLESTGGTRRTLSAVSAWHVVGDSWRQVGTMVTSAPRYARFASVKLDQEGRYISADFAMSSPRVTTDRYGLVALEDQTILRAAFLTGSWSLDRQPVTGPEAAWSEQITAAGSTLFRLSGGRLIAQDLDRPSALPRFSWGLPSGVTGLHSDGDSLWALTAAGPRLVTEGSGTWGFLNVRPLKDQSLSEEQRKLLSALEPWMGAPYVYGGSSKSGVDCSGLVTQIYLSLGYSLPRTSTLIRDSKLGVLVTDELQVGDVIWTPGHVALYVGNGETVEAIRGGVRRMTIWRFQDAIVKRFLRRTP